jgi:hypothetical protein
VLLALDTSAGEVDPKPAFRVIQRAEDGFLGFDVGRYAWMGGF